MPAFANFSVVRHSTLIMRLNIYILVTAFFVGIISCDRIKRKSKTVTRKAQDHLEAKRDAAIDKLIPTFDSYNPDTKYNKKRFSEFFGMAPSKDVSNIYCYNDQMGIDSKFQFAFRCDTTTRSRIVEFLGLSPERMPDNSSRGLWTTFKWWDSSKIETLVPYSFKIEDTYYRYLWYDDSANTVYYLDFDM
ncbi:MAG: hypothetical protein EOP48_03955 [Sphingobacteriales bacterium]|nr:MAG: hypothetical protein EOP48_03955 [Sphingobacteriales bacterium]